MFDKSKITWRDVWPGIKQAWSGETDKTSVAAILILTTLGLVIWGNDPDVRILSLAILLTQGLLLTWNIVTGVRAIRDARDFDSYISEMMRRDRQFMSPLDDLSILDQWFPLPADFNDDPE